MTGIPEQIGKYRLERELGRGAMGVVYQAFDPVVERHVALKTIRYLHADDGDLVDLFKREARSIGRFEHPNIVTLYDAGESQGLFYMVMQLVQGESLRERLLRQCWFRLPQITDIFGQILAGLGYAHDRGIIHRDIKPANIMLSTEGAIKLADFGIAKLIGPESSNSGAVVGTPSYMSPEQVLGRKIDARSDLFSVGCILYELLTGEKAFQGDSATAIMYKIVHQAPSPPALLRPGIHPGLEDIVMKALANDPDDRFSSCGEMAKAILACSTIPVTPLPAPLRPVIEAAAAFVPNDAVIQSSPPIHPRRRSALYAWIAVGFVTAVVLLLMVRSILSWHPPSPPPLVPSPLVEKASIPPPPVLSAPLAIPQPSQQHKPELWVPARAPKLQAPVADAAPSHVTRSTTPQTGQPDAQDFRSLLLRGDVAFEQNQYESAFQSYLMANKMKPADAGVRRKLKVVLTLLGRTAEAQAYR